MNLFSTADFAAPTIGWASLVPVLIVLGAAVVGVLVEAFAPPRLRGPIGVGVALVATLGAGVVLAARWTTVLTAPSSLGEYIEDPLTVATQFILVVIGFVAILVMADRTQVGDGAFAGQPSDRPGSGDEQLTLEKGYQRTEIFPLTLFSLGGMMVFPAADSFITLFVALELLSLPLYILSATARRRRQLSQEAGLKYFLLGAFSSGFLLLGSAFLYGYSGTLTISQVATALPSTNGMDWLVVAGSLLVVAGLLFKVAAVPFHAWTPDVYTGAPTPVTGFMAATVKVAAFATLVRFYQTIAGHLEWDLLPVLATISALTMLVGTFAGVIQDDVKRMLAYSSIAHAGFILIGVLSLQQGSAGNVLFYALSYAVATVGAFGVVTLVRSQDAEGAIGGEATALDRWAGLGRRSPWLAGSMLVFLLSFAGIPLTAGFIGKFVLFSDGFAAGLGWLVAIALFSSVVTAFFYFRLVRLMFFTAPSARTVAVTSEGFSAVAIAVCAVGTIVLGVIPNPVLSLLNQVVIFLP